MLNFKRAVGAENRDAFMQRLQRLALHAVQRIEPRFEIIGLGRIVIEIGDAALRIGVRDDVDNAPVRQMPGMANRLGRPIGLKQPLLPRPVVGFDRHALLGAQAVENFAVGRLLFEKFGVELPELSVSVIAIDEAPRSVEARHGRGQLIERAHMRLHLLLEIGAHRLDLMAVDGDRRRAARGRRLRHIEFDGGRRRRRR